MGIRDSSKTRVEPFFHRLYERDATGSTWLDGLIGLGSRHEVVATVPRLQHLVPNHGERWGGGEMPLPAPQDLLEHLAANLDAKLVAESGDTGQTLAKRTLLANGDTETIAEAIAVLRDGQRGRRWFVLEGESKPDALLEGSDVVVCIEGKRTEATCTTATQWMRQRAQLIRHMDAAMTRFRGKRVLGLLLVEGGKNADAVRTPEHWRNESAAAYSSTMIAASLPHRSDLEREVLAKNILGVSTWQAACRALDVDWDTLPDVI